MKRIIFAIVLMCSEPALADQPWSSIDAGALRKTGGTMTGTLNGIDLALTGNFSQTGAHTISTGTGAVSLNGAVTAGAAGTGLAVTNNETVGGMLTVTGHSYLNGGLDIIGDSGFSVGHANDFYFQGGKIISGTSSAIIVLGGSGGIASFRNVSNVEKASIDVNGLGTFVGLTSTGTVTLTSANFSQTGSSTFSTGTGAVSLNGAVTTSSTLTFGGTLLPSADFAQEIGSTGKRIGSIYISNGIKDGTGNRHYWHSGASSSETTLSDTNPAPNGSSNAVTITTQATYTAGNLLNVTNAGTVKALVDYTGLGLFNGGVQVGTTASAPSCVSGLAGLVWRVAGGAGVKDVVEVCAKDAGDAYAWRSIY